MSDHVRRVWRLSRGGESCVGAVMMDDALPADSQKRYLAVVSIASTNPDEREIRVGPDGRRFVAEPMDFDKPSLNRGHEFDDVETALAWLDANKRQLLAEGWIQISFDPTTH
jgi:hypothetical protein